MSGTIGTASRSSSSSGRSRKPQAVAAMQQKPQLPKVSTRPVSPSLGSRPPLKLSPSPKNPSSDDHPSSSSSSKAKENVIVTVRLRPLSAREVKKGDVVAWYADGDYTVRNEHDSSIAYGFDRVFGPATTTRHAYDVAAQHVVSGAMEGFNGTIFAYGVTSSGKTHTMHGQQKSPGIIPLAVKDVFGIIQETPEREYLLRISYLEIYNEVINDLLDPVGQNLRIREDAQGTYVEGVKEEVVLSPAHALSLIASGEEHRHVGSNNYNLLSSRSHTIFTFTIESSSRGERPEEEDVTLSQLNLIDLAGSESSKVETTGLRRKEGSYINKSLLTLGTVISKLTDAKATHIPYRDSKLTRLLQSSLSGRGRVSLICTVTPASSNSEETHNTLKFAHRSKHVEIKVSQNKILDEKSLIKKYQREISGLQQEFQQLKCGEMEKPLVTASNQDDFVNSKNQMKATQFKSQSVLDEEEQAKDALMGRIQKLTKLILVSTKNKMSPSNLKDAGYRRRHSFGEDELAYLPDEKREYIIDDDAISIDPKFLSQERHDPINVDDMVKDARKSQKRGMRDWFKLRKPDTPSGLSTGADNESSLSVSPSSSSQSSQHKNLLANMKNGQRNSVTRMGDDISLSESLHDKTQAGDLFGASFKNRCLLPSGKTITDQMDILCKQVKTLAGEVALCNNSLKIMAEQASSYPEDLHLQEQIKKLNHEIIEKELQMRVLQQRITGSIEANSRASSHVEMSQALAKVATQLNERTFELEIKSADNRILEEKMQIKISENTEMQETILLLRQQVDSLLGKTSIGANNSSSWENGGWKGTISSHEDTYVGNRIPTSDISWNGIFSKEDRRGCNSDTSLNSEVLAHVAEIENLKQEKVKLSEEKDALEIDNQNLAEEASYAKELATAAALELKVLAEEVTKLSYENAKLTSDLAAMKELAQCKAKCCQRHIFSNEKEVHNHGKQTDALLLKTDTRVSVEELHMELPASLQGEAALEAAVSKGGHKDIELQRRLIEAKNHEEYLETELTNTSIGVAKTRTGIGEGAHTMKLPQNGACLSSSNQVKNKKRVTGETCDNTYELRTRDEVKSAYEREKRKSKELASTILKLKEGNWHH